jgi:hypothetical protein
MASGHALSEHRRTENIIRIVDKHGAPRWSEMWRGLSWILQPGQSGSFIDLKNGSGCRPYIAYPFSREGGQKFSNWRARDHLGAIELDVTELEFAERAVGSEQRLFLIEPTLKSVANPNKQWGVDKWQELVAIVKHYGLVPLQIGPSDTVPLEGARFIETPTFRQAAAVMRLVRWCVLPDGGLHHANAALRINNATVLFGGVGDPNILGYPGHRNIAMPPACGKWMPCQHCRDIWSQLHPIDVFHYTPRNQFVR